MNFILKACPNDVRSRIVNEYFLDVLMDKHDCYAWSQIGNVPLWIVEANGTEFVLPIYRKEHFDNVTLIQISKNPQGDMATIFLKNTTYLQGEKAGYVAVTELIPNTSVFVTTFYHAWWLPPKYR